MASEHEASRRPITAVADEVAAAALRSRGEAPLAETRCDACDEPVTEEACSRGLYVWTRGEEVRLEEPALCSACATAIGMTARLAWSVEEEEG